LSGLAEGAIPLVSICHLLLDRFTGGRPPERD
jgi:hypothetical protein